MMSFTVGLLHRHSRVFISHNIHKSKNFLQIKKMENEYPNGDGNRMFHFFGPELFPGYFSI
jgi:hypothetical protein